MKYIFKVNILTDGDFYFPYVPCGMDYYYTNEAFYSMEKVYNDRESAIKDIADICAFLKKQINTSKDYVKEMFNEHIDKFIKRIYETDNTVNTCVDEYMSGNYDGTEFSFRVQPNIYNFKLHLTDEEYELIRKNKHLVSIGEVKDVILSLFKK